MKRTGGSASKTWADVAGKVLELAAPTGGNQKSQNNVLITERMVKLLGLEEATSNIPFVHVAGSKGKGTTCAYTAKLLEAEGMKVGLFTSPHLYDVRERFKINYDLIPRETFAKYFFDIYDRQKEIEAKAESESDRQASRSGFFRFTFYLALHAFAQEKCDVIVLETGLGGRMDSTNIITPMVSGITALGLEHTDVLGDTIEQIAREKAGIIKPKIPVYTVPQHKYPVTDAIIADTAREKESPLQVIDRKACPAGFPTKLAMEGDHILENARLALALSRHVVKRPMSQPILDVEKSVLESLTFDGRSQVVPISDRVSFFLDGAHTTESMELAAKWFQTVAVRSAAEGKKKKNVLMFYTQRDPAKLLPFLTQPLRTHLDKVVFVQVEFSRLADGEKCAVLSKCAATWQTLAKEVPIEFEETVLTSAADLEKVAQRDPETGNVDTGVDVNVFVTGSLYLVGTVLKGLKGDFTPPTTPRKD